MKKLIFVISVFVIFSTCSSNNEDRGEKGHPNESSEESLVKVNRYLVKNENDEIENYIHRHQWKMNETGSGLRYMIYEHGTGEKAKKGQIVELDYELSLITGDVISSSKQDGPMVFQIGHGGVESGLEEALLLMKKGDRAKLVIPSHLAHGFLGEIDKIPPRATLIYDIKIVNLK